MRSADVSSAEKQRVNFLGNEASIGDSVTFCLLKFMLTTGFIESRTADVVHIEIEVCTENNGVFVLSCLSAIRRRQGFQPLEMPCFANADQRSCADDIAVFIARSIFSKKINDARRQPSFQSQPNSQNPTVPQGTTPPTITQPDEIQQLPKVLTPALTQQKVEVNHLDLVEFDVIHLLLKCGMYETHISQTDEDGNTVICPIRVDQYVFNEFHDDEIVFQNPLYQQVYEEYAKIAQKAESQEDLEHAFVVHENEKIRNLAVSILMEEEPEYSEQWEKRFELHTNNITNSVQSLNTELSGCINLFKLRLIERHKKLLLNELGFEHTDEEQRQIMERLVELDKLRKKLADLLGMVISQSDDSAN